MWRVEPGGVLKSGRNSWKSKWNLLEIERKEKVYLKDTSEKKEEAGPPLPGRRGISTFMKERRGMFSTNRFDHGSKSTNTTFSCGI